MRLGVWSLRDLMEYFNVCHLTRALDFVEDIGKRCASVIVQTDRVARDIPVPPTVCDDVRPKLEYLRRKCAECELTNAARRIDQNLIPGIQNGITFDHLLNQVAELKRDIDNDLEFRRFIFIPDVGAQVLDGVGGRWEGIWKTIPSCKSDVRDAALSYALQLYTATIFHSMRAAEFGLRHLAKKLKVTVSDKGKKIPIEFAVWDKIITNCKNKITEARKLPANAKRDQRLQYYSRAADHCEYMKDIWRNEAAHTRKSYIEPEARAALDRVHAFMDFLAAGSK